MNDIFLVIGAYLLGSIPTAVWVGKRFYNIDVREHGSGNAGATNVFRVLGKKAGIPVLLIDVLKGFIAVSLAKYSLLTDNSFVNLQLVLGAASLIGHVFPVFASFRGGKGIATLLGIVIAVFPVAAVYAIAIFLTVFLLSGYVSLGSMTAAVAFPIIVVFVLKIKTITLVIFSVLIAIMVLLTHKKNIQRLINKEEPKTRLINRNK